MSEKLAGNGIRNVKTIILHIAKNMSQVHGFDVDRFGSCFPAPDARAMLSFFAKLPPCLIGIESRGHDRRHHRQAALRPREPLARTHRVADG